MRLLKFNAVKISMAVTVLYGLSKVLLMNSMSYLVVDDVTILFRNGCVIVLLYFVSALLMGMNEYLKAKSDYYITRQMNSWIDRHYEQMVLQEYQSKTVGERASVYVNDVAKVVGLTFYKANSIVFNGTLIVFVLVSLLKIHWSMFLLGIISTCILLLVPKLFEKKLSDYVLQSQRGKEKFLEKITEILTGFSCFAETCAYPRFRKKSEEASEAYADSLAQIDIFAGNVSAVTTFVENLSTVLALLLVAFLVINGKASSGMLLAVIGLMPTLGEAASVVVLDKTFYQSGKVLFAEKFWEIQQEYEKKYTRPVLRGEKQTYAKQVHHTEEKQIHTIETQGIVVPYEKELKIRDIKLEAGKKYAIVGASGCGKSTLLKVIVGEVSNYSGNVLIDGVTKGKTQTLFDAIAYMNQSTFLFNDTLENNININQEEMDVRLILDKVGMSEYDPRMKISENGKNLSGGQRQRIALARAIAQKKQVLFLDEATANLDPKTAQFVEDYVLSQDWTVVMITHKLTDVTREKLDEVIDIG